MLKEYLKEKEISCYALSQMSDVSYSTLNDLINGRVQVENIKAGNLKKISESLHISMDWLYNLCDDTHLLVEEKYNVEYQIVVRDKTYFVRFSYDGKDVEIKLYKVKSDIQLYIDDIAEWRVRNYIMERRMEAYDGLLSDVEE